MSFEITPENTQYALEVVSAYSYIKNSMETLRRDSIDYLNEVMEPGDSKKAKAPDGTEIATVSKPMPTEKQTIQVTDVTKFVAWCEKHGVEYAMAEPQLADWVTTKENLNAILDANGGELPDGMDIDITESQRRPSVRQSAKQRTNMARAVQPSQIMGILTEGIES